MEKELCFIIENKKIYLEKVLVDYREIPIFFLCKNSENYYISLCYDIENYNYYVFPAKTYTIYRLLHQKITMQEAMLNSDFYYDVISGETIVEDNIVKKAIAEIDKSALPEKKAVFKILTRDIKDYVINFDNYYFRSELFNKFINQIALDEEIILTRSSHHSIENFIKYSFCREINDSIFIECDVECSTIEQYTLNDYTFMAA